MFQFLVTHPLYIVPTIHSLNRPPPSPSTSIPAHPIIHYHATHSILLPHLPPPSLLSSPHMLSSLHTHHPRAVPLCQVWLKCKAKAEKVLNTVRPVVVIKEELTTDQHDNNKALQKAVGITEVYIIAKGVEGCIRVKSQTIVKMGWGVEVRRPKRRWVRGQSKGPKL